MIFLQPGQSSSKAASIASDLMVDQRQQLRGLADEFLTISQEVLRCTNLTEHEIQVGDIVLIHQKPYWSLYSQRDVVQKELEEMATGVIWPSMSPWASLIILWKRMVESSFAWTIANSTKYQSLMLTLCLTLKRC